MSEGYDLGLDFKSETDDNPQLINTLSFPEGARHWFPSYDHPNDRATQETIVTIQAKVVVTDDVNRSESVEGKTFLSRWKRPRGSSPRKKDRARATTSFRFPSMLTTPPRYSTAQ